MTLISISWTSPFSVVTFQFLLLMEFTYRSWYVTLEPVLIIRIFWSEVQLWHKGCQIKDMKYRNWSLPSRNFMVVTMNWLTLMELLFHSSLLMCFHKVPGFCSLYSTFEPYCSKYRLWLLGRHDGWHMCGRRCSLFRSTWSYSCFYGVRVVRALVLCCLVVSFVTLVLSCFLDCDFWSLVSVCYIGLWLRQSRKINFGLSEKIVCPEEKTITPPFKC